MSAIVIFLDAERFLAEAIESVIGQTFTEWELILVDDGSTDGSREIAERYARQSPDRVRVVEHAHGVNRGMSASRNLGLTVATGAFVAFLDADDEWPERKLEVQVRVLEEDPSIAAVIGTIQFFGDRGVGPARRPATPLDVRLCGPQLLFATLLAQTRLLTTLGNPLIRRSALVDVGGSEPEFTAIAEDLAVWCKLALRYPFKAIDVHTLRYRRHSMASGIGDARTGQIARGNARFARWFLCYVEQQPAEIRAWALPIAAEFVFRAVILEAWQVQPERPIRRRIRLANASMALARAHTPVLTSRRVLRLLLQITVGLRAGALRRFQEPELRNVAR